MHRTPHRALESFARTTTLVPRGGRPALTPSSRLRAALMPELQPAGLAVHLPLVALPANAMTHLQPRPRGLGQVPPLADPRRFPVASIDLSRKDAALPYGLGRFVNAATLKRIAGGQRSDRLLKKSGNEWEFVEDDAQVDLTDNTQEFRLGKLTILS